MADKSPRQHLVTFFALLILGFLVFLGMSHEGKKDILQEASVSGSILTFQTSAHEEIYKILSTNNLEEQGIWYRQLIERVGVEEAQEALVRSGLPFTGETHVLNHEAGEFLYEKEGPEGILRCKDYFLSSCYHGLLIQAIAEEGFLALSTAMDACKKAGRRVVTQCAHAIGHGLLAWVGYKNLPEALTLCDKVESDVADFPVYNCHDGVFMENNYALHLGSPSPDRWIKADDSFYPCNDARIEEKYRKACWSNQPQMILEVFMGDFGRVGRLCEKVENDEYRITCFNSIARNIHSFTFGDAGIAFYLCSYMPKEQYVDCVADVGASEFAIGGRSMPYEICARIGDEYKENCYEKLYHTIFRHEKADESQEKECKKIQEEPWKGLCLERITP